MLQGLLEQVKRAIFDDPHNPYQENHAPGGLIDQISGLFGQHQQQMGSAQNPLPASEDPYGDPADQLPNQGNGGYAYADGNRGGGVQQRFPNVRPASEDPYGDPADQR